MYRAIGPSDHARSSFAAPTRKLGAIRMNSLRIRRGRYRLLGNPFHAPSTGQPVSTTTRPGKTQKRLNRLIDGQRFSEFPSTRGYFNKNRSVTGSRALLKAMMTRRFLVKS